MALYELGSGLLGTHVTWDDIEGEMRAALGTEASFGPDRKIVDIAYGNGFVSRIGLVEPDWQNNIENQELPRKFIVKIVTLMIQVEYREKLSLVEEKEEVMGLNEINIKEINNVEVNIYNTLKAVDGAGLLKVYAARAFSAENPSKGFILMEAVEDIHEVHMDTAADDSIMRQVLRRLAKFHSLGVYFEKSRESIKRGMLSEAMDPMFKPEFLSTILPLVRGFLGEQSNDVVDQLETDAGEMTLEYRRTIDNGCEHRGIERVLCHGDVWSCNMLFTKKEDEEVQLKALIDFQTVHFGCVAHDLCRMMCNMLTTDDRRTKWRTYLADYMVYLKEYLGSKDMPFTMEQLSSSFEEFFAPCAFVMILSISIIGHQIAHRRKEEDIPKAAATMKDKVSGLLEDYPAYHRRNLVTFKNLSDA